MVLTVLGLLDLGFFIQGAIAHSDAWQMAGVIGLLLFLALVDLL